MSAKFISTFSINKLALAIFLGWPEEERKTKQTVFLDVNFSFTDLPRAFITDELSDTFCYQTLIEKIHHFVAQKKFRLVENFCYEIHQFIKSTMNSPVYLSVLVKKHPPIQGLEEVAVSCTDA